MLKANPGLGWAFANRIAGSGRANPLVKKKEFRMINAAILLLCADQRGEKPPSSTDIVNRARELDESAVMKPVLRAALLATDGTLETVAAALHLPVEVLSAYHDLFFNVLDRKDDLEYMRMIIEGSTSPSMAFVLEQAGRSAVDPLLKIARNGTVDDVMTAAGLGKVVKREIWENTAALSQQAMTAAADWFLQAGNRHKSPPELVKLGLALVRRTVLPAEPAPAPLGLTIGEAFGQALADDRTKLFMHLEEPDLEVIESTQTNSTDDNGQEITEE